jgi:transcription elongation factor Elf1
MDDIFLKIGVIQDNEESVLHRYLQSKGISTNSTKEKNEKVVENQENVHHSEDHSRRLLSSAGMIAQSIIEKSLPDDLPSQDERLVETISPRAKKHKTTNKQRPTVKRLSLATEASLSKKEPKTRKNISELNNILLEATDQLKAMKEKKIKTASVFPRLTRTSDSVSSTSKHIKEQPLFYECPICERKFEVEFAKVSSLDALMNKHIDRCLRRKTNDVPSCSSIEENGLSSSSSALSPFSRDTKNKGQEFLDFVSSEESDEEGKQRQYLRNQSRRRKKRKSCPSSSENDGEPENNSEENDEIYLPEDECEMAAEQEFDNDDDDPDNLEKEINEDLSLSNSNGGNLIGDDWEEEHFLARINKIRTLSLPTIQTSYGAEMTSSVWTQLYDYQKEGTKWLYSLYCDGLGGILADEMGKMVGWITLCSFDFITFLFFSLFLFPCLLFRSWKDSTSSSSF